MNRESLPTDDLMLVAEPRAGYAGSSDYSFRDLRVWQSAVELAVECYKATDAFPKQEQFGISSQLQRAAVSVSANIAEGYGRDSKAEFARFLDIAMGSLNEVQSLLEIALRLGYLSNAQLADLAEKADHTGRQLHKLRSAVRTKPKT